MFEGVAKAVADRILWHENTTLLPPFSGAFDAGASAPITARRSRPGCPAAGSGRRQGTVGAGRAASKLTPGRGRKRAGIQWCGNSGNGRSPDRRKAVQGSCKDGREKRTGVCMALCFGSGSEDRYGRRRLFPPCNAADSFAGCCPYFPLAHRKYIFFAICLANPRQTLTRHATAYRLPNRSLSSPMNQNLSY